MKINPTLNDCPPPTKNVYLALCVDFSSRAKVSSNENEFYQYTFEKRIL